jgi:hypothetical protein
LPALLIAQMQFWRIHEAGYLALDSISVKLGSTGVGYLLAFNWYEGLLR